LDPKRTVLLVEKGLSIKSAKGKKRKKKKMAEVRWHQGP